MPRHPRPSNLVPVDSAARLRPLLWRWLGIGVLLLICVPAARGASLWIGWLPYWLVLAPSICLAVLERRQIVRLIRHRRGTVQRGVHRRGSRQARRQPVPGSRHRLNPAAMLAGLFPPAV